MNKDIKAAIIAQDKATAVLSQHIYDAIEKEARRRNLKDVKFLVWGEEFFDSNGKEVESKKISNLHELYCEHVHRGGILGGWNDKLGWL